MIAEVRAMDGDAGMTARHLMHRGTEFLGSETAIMCGAMSWVSERHLVSAISNAGGFGVIACGAMTPSCSMRRLPPPRRSPPKPFGVNLITMHPQFIDLIAVCAQHKVSHVVLAGGLPPGQCIEAIKEMGAKVICFAPALALAKKLLRSGADALVIEGMEAGGHIGPVSTSVLAQEILPDWPHESRFSSPAASAAASDRGLSRNGRGRGPARHPLRLRPRKHRPSQFQEAPSSAPTRATRSRGSRSTRACRSSRCARSRTSEMEFTAKQREVAQLLDDGAIDMEEAQLEIEHYWAGALRRAVIDGDVENGSVMAGQSVGMVKREEPVADIIQELVDEAAAALESRGFGISDSVKARMAHGHAVPMRKPCGASGRSFSGIPRVVLASPAPASAAGAIPLPPQSAEQCAGN